MHKLFSYGTLQQENVQLETYGRKLHGVPDELLGYTLEMLKITDPVVLKTSGKKYHPILRKTNNPTDFVKGIVFEITDRELVQTDAYEVSDYKRVFEVFKSGTEAWVYVKEKD